MEKAITCPTCGAKISFIDGTIVEGCVVCHTKFVNPAHVAVSATVVSVEPISANFSANGGK